MFSKKIQLKHFLVFVLSLVFSIFVYGCSGSGSSSSGGGDTPPAVITSISIINAPEYLDYGEEYQLMTDRPELNIMWDTSNQDLLEIDNNGLIRAKDVAEAMVEITASYGDIKDVVSIYVKAPETPYTPVSSVNIGVQELKFDMLAGEQLHLTSEVLPENATNKTVMWWVSDTSLAIIDENGVLTANGENKSGKVTVTAKAGKHTATKNITILSHANVIPVQEVKITGVKEIAIGNSALFKAEVVPSDATFNRVTWKSSDEWVAEVDSTGRVSASSKPGAYPGTAVITATAGGVSSSYEVTVVYIPVKSVTIKGYEDVTVDGKTTLGINDVLQLQATITPENASCKDILWISSNMEIALTDANGRVVHGNQTGPVTITATAVDKSNQPCGETASASIDVEFVPYGTEIPVSDIKIKGYDEMGVEGQVTFKAEFFPANATDNKVTWSSNNDTAVSIEQDSITGDAIITALAEAENVVITAAAGGKTAEYTIKTIRKVLHGYEPDENGVYLIYNKTGFSNCFWNIQNKSFKLMTDLDFRGDETVHASDVFVFDGTFDGNGHIIREYKVKDSPSGRYGFVSVLGGTIMNVTFDTPVIRLLGITHRETYTGVVAGENNGTIKNVSINNAAVELEQVFADLSANAGLITGQSTGVIDNCTVDTGSLVINNATSKTVLGGIAGINKGKIISSAANNINNLTNPAKSVDYITATGGIAGVLSSGSYVKGSYATGQITAQDYAGGIAGVVEQGAADVSAYWCKYKYRIRLRQLYIYNK